MGLGAAGAAGPGGAPAWAADEPRRTDPYEESVRDARMVWDRPPEDWQDAPCLGDGSLRVQVRCGDSPNLLAFEVRDTSDAWQSAAARLVLRFAGTPTAHHWQLDLWHAELKATITTTRGRVHLTALVPHGSGVLVVRLSTEGAESEAAWQPTPAGHPLPLQEETRGPARVLVAGADAGAVRRALAALQRLDIEHRRWWQDHYRRGFLSVPDRTVQRFYWAQIYLSAAALRRDTPVTGFGHPLLGTTDHLALDPVVAATGHRPRTASHNHLYGGLPGVGSKGGRASDPISSWGLPAVEAAYRTSMDQRILRDWLHPALRKAVGFYTYFLVAEPDGRLHLPATHSPHYADVPDASHALALLRWALSMLIDSTRRLGIQETALDRWRDIAARLTSYPTGPDGVLIGRGAPLARSHPYASHLLWLHPLREGLPQARTELARRSYAHWASMRDNWHGSSYVTAAGLAAAVGEASEASSHLRHFLANLGGGALYRAGRGEEGGETAVSVPLGAGQAALDLLLDSWGGTLRVFPATPQEWPDTTVAGLRAPGAFLVDAERSHGRTDWVRVRSEAGEPLLLDHGIEGSFEVLDENGRPRPWQPSGPRAVRVPLGRGESVVVVRRGQRPAAEPRMVEAAGTPRAWGMSGPQK
ncbi:glycoside hydrolase family 95-like protein [Streptomyces sp. NPDC058751]|uniref:glycosyl hydrolase family 95 catalytic domain-containing protein n=1 Tax=Streptomyces sp. NPDC058751 TaxID=3346623 RepID=UPI0036A9F20B